jgi:hypothetical protein
LERPKRAVQKASYAEVHPWLAMEAHGNNNNNNNNNTNNNNNNRAK